LRRDARLGRERLLDVQRLGLRALALQRGVVLLDLLAQVFARALPALDLVNRGGAIGLARVPDSGTCSAVGECRAAIGRGIHQRNCIVSGRTPDGNAEDRNDHNYDSEHEHALD